MEGLWGCYLKAFEGRSSDITRGGNTYCILSRRTNGGV